MIFVIVIGILIYIVGMSVYISSETKKDIKFHEGGFLGMGYITHSNRKTTPKDVRMSLLWPILLILWFIKLTIWILNDALSFILLIFNYRYKESNIYNFIDRKCG